MMECVSCEINLLKREAKMNDYSKASVEVLNHMSELSVKCFCCIFFLQALDPLKEA